MTVAESGAVGPVGATGSLLLENVSKRFGGLQAVNGVDLRVSAGERLAIIGPNGAGKTTLFNIISGEFPPTEGRILLFGEDVTRLPNHERVRRGLARTYQITTLFSELTVLENALLGLMGVRALKFSMVRPLSRNRGLREEAEGLLSSLGLEDKIHARVRDLSYGDQRLLEIVLALASKPRIVALDEPTAGLSVAESKIMVNALQNLSRDMTVLLIEHDMDMVFEVVDMIMVLHQGRVVAVDSTQRIRQNERVQQIYLGVGE